MNEPSLFPQHVTREEERKIREQVELVRRDHGSRAVLLSGAGGTGKTSLVRELVRAGSNDATTIWVEPVDIDDSEYWLLSNLESKVAERLDPEDLFFARYRDYLSRLPRYTRRHVGHETVVSHLGRIKRVFAECYEEFIRATGKTVVITLDTVEVMRGMYLLLTLTQWMKALPGTLFILSGRPAPGGGRKDPIQEELGDPHQGMPIAQVHLGEFTEEAAHRYLGGSRVTASLSEEEIAKLVRLTRGSPLWLAFTIAYLDERGIPEEAAGERAVIETMIPFRGEVDADGQHLIDAFKRRLVTPYRETDFWHEAVKRLAVIRQSVSQEVWVQLMLDRPLPVGLTSLDDAWHELLRTPWIRTRANGRYVTLHDAVADELAERIIPLHDQDEQWRRELWWRAVRVYEAQIEGPEAMLITDRANQDERIEQLLVRRPDEELRDPTEEERTLIKEVARADAQKRELDQLKAIRLYYLLLSSFDGGCLQFKELFDQAKIQHDVLFQDLLAMEMQRFLPDPDRSDTSGVVGKAIDEFGQWLASSSPDVYVEIGLSLVDYLIRNERPATAIELLDKLPEINEEMQHYRICLLRGNACMRIPGRVRDGLPYFDEALRAAENLALTTRPKLVAEAYKELGFYHRNEGSWQAADEAYARARDAISSILSSDSSDEDREEMASIQSNWAYVKGLGGSYRDGLNLVESAITVRHRLKKHQEEGNSWSVCGEVYRYERRFEKAWSAYAQAERIFQEYRNWPWLGLVYQEQAICLFQATQDGIRILPGKDPIEQAKLLITVALDVCRDQGVRSYPSALNRAGRIFGHEDPDEGLQYLAEGIEQARVLSDGWFWFANLLEFVELSYRTWVTTGRTVYRDRIAEREAAITDAVREYEFPDLRGRWDLVRGHLAIHDTAGTWDASVLGDALEFYKNGFALIAQRYVGSSGAAAIPDLFRTFGETFRLLPPSVQAQWQGALREAWSAVDEGSTLLLARLEELY
jgi:tetratricopeptide (TPR) repeat protein